MQPIKNKTLISWINAWFTLVCAVYPFWDASGPRLGWIYGKLSLNLKKKMSNTDTNFRLITDCPIVVKSCLSLQVQEYFCVWKWIPCSWHSGLHDYQRARPGLEERGEELEENHKWWAKRGASSNWPEKSRKRHHKPNAFDVISSILSCPDHSDLCDWFKCSNMVFWRWSHLI